MFARANRHGPPEGHRPRRRRRRRLSAMELPLSGLPVGLGEGRPRAAPDPGQPRRLRRWRALGSAQRLSRFARAVGGDRALQPKSGVRGSPIAAVVLTGAEIDQIAGLLHLRERQAFAIHATREALDSSPPTRSSMRSLPTWSSAAPSRSANRSRRRHRRRTVRRAGQGAALSRRRRCDNRERKRGQCRRRTQRRRPRLALRARRRRA